MVCRFCSISGRKAECILPAVHDDKCPKTKLKLKISQFCFQYKLIHIAPKRADIIKDNSKPLLSACGEIPQGALQSSGAEQGRSNLQENNTVTLGNKKPSTHDTLKSLNNPAGNFFQNRKPYHTPKSEIPPPADDTHKEAK